MAISGVSALIAVISAGYVMYVRWRDRPEAAWHFGRDAMAVSTRRAVDMTREGHAPLIFVRCTNIGDGAAYGVTVEGDGCDVQMMQITEKDKRGFSTPSLVGRLAPNDFVLVMVWPRRKPEDPQQHVAEHVDLRVQWTEGPVRHQRHREQALRIRGAEPGPHPPRRLATRKAMGLAPN